MLRNADLGDITRDNPTVENSKHFNREAHFPDDITSYMQGERWWEALGTS
jgi:hypothetical protein